jgi:hypothetical protein
MCLQIRSSIAFNAATKNATPMTMATAHSQNIEGCLRLLLLKDIMIVGHMQDKRHFWDWLEVTPRERTTPQCQLAMRIEMFTELVISSVELAPFPQLAALNRTKKLLIWEVNKIMTCELVWPLEDSTG